MRKSRAPKAGEGSPEGAAGDGIRVRFYTRKRARNGTHGGLRELMPINERSTAFVVYYSRLKAIFIIRVQQQ